MSFLLSLILIVGAFIVGWLWGKKIVPVVVKGFRWLIKAIKNLFNKKK